MLSQYFIANSTDTKKECNKEVSHTPIIEGTQLNYGQN